MKTLFLQTLALWALALLPINIPGQQTPGSLRPPVLSRQEVSSPRTAQEPARPEYAVAVESPLVTVDVLVTDEDGNVLTGLKQSNFRILDEGKPQIITSFAPAAAPITIVILMEYSGIAYDYFAHKSAYWSSQFLNHLEENDWVALVTYDIKPTVQVDFTRSRPEIEQALGNLSYPQLREANLFDALLETLDQLEPVEGKKSILLIGTGADTFSKGTLDETYDRLKQTSATIFCIGVAESEYLSADLRGGGNIAYLQMKNQLETFAKLTGGFAWFPRFEGELPSIFRSVGGTLRNQYALSFSPPKELRDGKYHRFKVEIVGGDGRPLKVTNKKGQSRKVLVHTRKGYTAPKNTVMSGTRTSRGPCCLALWQVWTVPGLRHNCLRRGSGFTERINIRLPAMGGGAAITLSRVRDT